MENSILNTVKAALGLAEDDTSFQTELIMYINTVLATLNQIGVGPQDGFQIEDAAATWDDLLGPMPDLRQNNVQTYVSLKIRLLFDPPQTAHAIDAMERLVKEQETRIYLFAESTTWVNPYTPPPDYYAYYVNLIDGC